MTISMAIQTLFWISFAVVTYVYFGYPVALRIGLFGDRNREERPSAPKAFPMVSVIIAARNEEAGIEAKLKNLLASSYPRERMEILVGSDGSSDRTEAIVRSLAAEGVGLISFPYHQGKSAMQNRLVAASSGDVLVFTDADCLISPDALTEVVAHLQDPSVGLVTGRPLYQNSSDTAITENESTYLDYETWLREQESARDILAVASGSFFVMRRELWKLLDADLGDDFVLPLQVRKSGFRNILEPRAMAFTRLAQDCPAAMLRLKLRIISKDFHALLVQHALLNPFAHGRFAIGLWSHKLLRWLVPYFLMAILTTSTLLSASPAFRLFSILQIALYVFAAGVLVFSRHKLPGLLSVPASFCLVNFAALLGTLKCLVGGVSGRWEPERSQPAPIPAPERVATGQRE